VLHVTERLTGNRVLGSDMAPEAFSPHVQMTC
jgi:hypothetical protein